MPSEFSAIFRPSSYRFSGLPQMRARIGGFLLREYRTTSLFSFASFPSYTSFGRVH
jgi:hypothetical protein